MPTIKPLRVVDEHDVLNWFKFNPTGSYPLSKGTFVKIWSGVMQDQVLQQLESAGASYGNVVSQRYGVQPFVTVCTNSGDNAIGMTLYDVREYDENGEKLLFHPDKQAKMQAVLSGQCVPIVTKGIFLYSGVNGTPAAGAKAYLHNDGTVSANGVGAATQVGSFLGPKDSNGWVYLRLNIV